MLHVTVPRTARLYALGDAATARELWVAIHGYGQLASHFVRHFAPHLAERLIVAPEALSRFYLESREGNAGAHGPRVGATWMTREDREAEIADYVRWLDLAVRAAYDTRAAEHVPLHVLAFSQGTATACRWLAARAASGAAPARRLVLWAGDTPPDLDLDAAWLRATRVTLVAGRSDPFVTPERFAELEARLTTSGVRLDVVRFDGAHRVDAGTLAAVLGDRGAARRGA